MSFALDLKKFADKTDQRVNAVVGKIVLDVGTSLVMKSPVGDPKYWVFNRGDKTKPDYVNFEAYRDAPDGYVGGRFRANWQYGVGDFDVTTTEQTDKSGRVSIARITTGLGSQPAGKVHYLGNSLPYAERLENGWSRQAPSGMVGLTVLEFNPIVDAAAKALS